MIINIISSSHNVVQIYSNIIYLFKWFVAAAVGMRLCVCVCCECVKIWLHAVCTLIFLCEYNLDFIFIGVSERNVADIYSTCSYRLFYLVFFSVFSLTANKLA